MNIDSTSNPVDLSVYNMTFHEKAWKGTNVLGWFYYVPMPKCCTFSQFSSYRLAKPLKPIFFPKVAKSEANSHFSHRAQLGPRWPKSKSFKAQNQALAFSFQAKKRFGSIWLCYGWQIAIPWRWYEAKCHKMAPNFKSSYLGLGRAELRSVKG